MSLLIVLHFDLLPFFLDSLTDILLVVGLRECRELARGNWHQSWAPGLTRLPAATSSPSPRHHTRQEALGTQIFYFLELYTNVKYFNNQSMGKLFGFKLL